MNRLHAILLAGGQSTRMGKPKEQLDVHGTPVLDRMIEKCEKLTPHISVVLKPSDSTFSSSVKVVHDQYPGKGPIAGIHAGMTQNEAESYLVLACDYPLVRISSLEKIVQVAKEEKNTDGVVPVVDGRMHPLIAVYHRRTYSYWESALKTGQYKVKDTLARLNIRQASFPDEENEWMNMNTPEQYRRVLGFISEWGP